MHLVLFPKTSNLAAGAGIGVAMVLAGRWLVSAQDNAAIWPIVGALLMIGGAYVAATCAFRIWRPSPSFAADEEGFSVMGKRKQPWDRFQGVGVFSMKQYGMTTNQSIYVRVGKGPTFARKRHIKWTHLSDSAPDMAEKIHAFATRQTARTRLNNLVAHADAVLERAAAAQAHPQAPHDVRQADTAKPKVQPTGDFADSPIKSGGGGLRGLFGG